MDWVHPIIQCRQEIPLEVNRGSRTLGTHIVEQEFLVEHRTWNGRARNSHLLASIDARVAKFCAPS